MRREVLSVRQNETRGLPSHEGPRVAVDSVLFTISEGILCTLLVEIKKGPFAGIWAFPGGLVRREESLDSAAERELYEKTGVEQLYLEQLYTFGKKARDPSCWTISVAYFALVPSPGGPPSLGNKYADIAWVAVHNLPNLAYDHNAVAEYALTRLQAKLSYSDIAYSLLPPEFTIAELQKVYEIILDRQLDRRNFRRKIIGSQLVQTTRGIRRGSHRPAQLYAFSDHHGSRIGGNGGGYL